MDLHEQALKICRSYLKIEGEMVEIFLTIDRTQYYKTKKSPSLFSYLTEQMGLGAPVAQALVTVVRKCAKVPALKEAIAKSDITFSTASRIVSALTPENAAQILEFAINNSVRATEAEIRKLDPSKEPTANRKLRRSTIKKGKRVQALLKGADFDAAVARAFDEFLERHDPVMKAERAEERKTRKEAEAKAESRNPQSQTAPPTPKSRTFRTLRTAEQRHAVFRRCKGECSFVHENGVKCTSDTWVDIHHVIPVARGGTNDPENLTLLCSFHHDLVHPAEPSYRRWVQLDTAADSPDVGTSRLDVTDSRAESPRSTLRPVSGSRN